MNILHVSALPIWPIQGKGGMPSLYETLEGHRRGGHTITVILPQYGPFGDDPDRIEIPPGTEYEVYFAPCRWLSAVKEVRRAVKPAGGSQEIPFVFRWIINMTVFKLLTISLVLTAIRVKRRTRQKFDLIYAHNQYAALAGWILRFMFRVPNVTRLYGTFLADLMNRPLVWLRYPTAAAGYLVPSRLLICGNDGTRGDEVAKKLKIQPQRFRFWQNGIDPPKAPLRITREEFLRRAPRNLRADSVWICSCSRLSYWKRIDRIFQALRICRMQGQNAQVLLAGDGPERESLTKLARELDIEENVVWLGAIPHDDIWAMMNLSDIFIITNDVTNRCNPLYEAIYASLPVVSIYDCSTQDLLKDGENALLADRENVEQLGHCLVRLCQSPPLREKLSQAQKSVAATFWSWEERLAEEVRELEMLVTQSPGGSR